jgi:sugar transferase (PEP-CTERM system associated)
MNNGFAAVEELEDDVVQQRVELRPAQPIAAVNDAKVDEWHRPGTLRIFSGHYHRLFFLLAAEGAVVVCALYAALVIRFQEWGSQAIGSIAGPMWPRALALTTLVCLSLAAMGLYQLRQRAVFAGVLARILVAVAMAETGLAVLFYALPELFVGRGVMVLAGIMAAVGLGVVRYVFLRIVDQDLFKRRVLVWGDGERAAIIGNRLRRRVDQRGFRLMGYVRTGAGGSFGTVPVVDAAQALQFIVRNRIEEIVVAMDDRRDGFPTQLLRECRMRGIVIRDIVTFLENESGRVDVNLAQPSWLIFCDSFRNDLLRSSLKRAFDVSVSLLILVLTSPILLATAIAIKMQDGGPVLYRQVRTGRGGKAFQMYKFRSMGVDAEAKGSPVWAAKNDPRVTRIGAFIRKVRIDEIPQAVNVLRGEMSFVGPRPERPAFVEQLGAKIPFYAERHFVKPGITGWAQVSFPYGSSEADAREKLGFDLYYVKNHNVVFDFMVLLRTVEIVLFRVGSR